MLIYYIDSQDKIEYYAIDLLLNEEEKNSFMLYVDNS